MEETREANAIGREEKAEDRIGLVSRSKRKKRLPSQRLKTTKPPQKESPKPPTEARSTREAGRTNVQPRFRFPEKLTRFLARIPAAVYGGAFFFLAVAGAWYTAQPRISIRPSDLSLNPPDPLYLPFEIANSGSLTARDLHILLVIHHVDFGNHDTMNNNVVQLPPIPYLGRDQKATRFLENIITSLHPLPLRSIDFTAEVNYTVLGILISQSYEQRFVARKDGTGPLRLYPDDSTPRNGRPGTPPE